MTPPDWIAEAVGLAGATGFLGWLFGRRKERADITQIITDTAGDLIGELRVEVVRLRGEVKELRDAKGRSDAQARRLTAEVDLLKTDRRTDRLVIEEVRTWAIAMSAWGRAAMERLASLGAEDHEPPPPVPNVIHHEGDKPL